MKWAEFYEQPTLPHVPGEPALEKVPERIGPYKIESLLSRGGMSLLYLGLSPKNEPLVIKVLSPNYLSHPEMVDQFLKEAKIIALTDHPNIVKLHGQGEWEEGLYIAMEFIQGISLKQFIVQHSLSLRRSLEIILEVAYALLHLHTHGVIHRDLKPENILITEAGKVKVIDFGIAQLTMDKETIGGGIIGTPSYMSPEQKKNPLKVTYASDIFSIGVILYELVLGKLSYGTIQLSLLPKQLRPILAKALDPDLSKRYADIVDFITDVSNYLKTQSFLQDRTGEDEVKEIRENLQSAYQSLLPPLPKNWPELDIGMAKTTKYHEYSMYYDFIRLDDRSYLILLAQTLENRIEDLIKLVLFKGILQKQKQSLSTPLLLDAFVSELNEITPSLAMHILHLRPTEDAFSFISCSFDSIWHYVMDQNSVRQLINRNPPLGKESSYSFNSVTDNWNEGDMLMIHTFHGFNENLEAISSLDHQLEEDFQKSTHLSASNCAEAILKKHFSLDQRSQGVITIQRIA